MIGAFFLVVYGCLAAASEEPAAPVDLVVHVVNEAGQPQAGVEVHCVAFPEKKTARLAPIQPHETALTDAAGNCTFPGLPGESYMVRAFKGEMNAWRPVKPRNKETTEEPFTLRPLSPAPLQFWDVHGNPLSGVQVTMSDFFPLGVSGADGRLTVPILHRWPVSFYKEGYGYISREGTACETICILVPGTKVALYAVDSEHKPVVGSEVFFNGFATATDANGWARGVDLSPGEKLRSELHYLLPNSIISGLWGELIVQPTPRHVFTLVMPPLMSDPDFFHSWVAGRVQMAETGKPVPASIISRSERSNMGYPHELNEPDGTFRFRAAHDHSIIMARPVDPVMYVIEGKLKVDLKAGDVEGLLFTVAPGHAIRGKALDSEGRPFAGRVTLESPGRFIFGSYADDGTFAFDNLEPVKGTYKVVGENVSIEFPVPPPGTMIDNLVLNVPPRQDAYTLVGKVLDQNNEPAVGVSALLNVGESEFDVLHTNTSGEFRAEYHGHGELSATFSKTLRVQKGALVAYLRADCALISGGKTQVEEGAKLAELNAQIVVPPPGVSILAGTVTDQDGFRLKAEMRVLRNGRQPGRVSTDESGFLYAERPDAEPLAIECTAPGYRPVILLQQRDFNFGDLNTTVVLKRGPFEEDDNIWSAVTRRTDNWFNVLITPGGRHIRARLREYQDIAAQEPVPETLEQLLARDR